MRVSAYHVPLRHAHPTVRTMMERLEVTDGHVGFSRELQPKEADEALVTAHNCLLVALDVQEERFDVSGLEGSSRERSDISGDGLVTAVGRELEGRG